MSARRVTSTRTESAVEPEVEDRRPDRPDNDRRILKIEDVLWFILAVVAAIIIVRFVLLLLGARTGVPFVDFWYNMSAPLIAPFAGMFGNLDTYNVYTGQRLELEAIIALLVYGLLGYLLVMGVGLLTKEPKSRA